MCFSNLVVILPKLCSAPSAGRSPTYKASATIGTIGACPTYTRDQLMHIKLDTWYSKISFRTIQLVRKLKINKHPSKLELGCNQIKQYRSNTKNLVKIDIINNDKITRNNLRIAMVNTRSLKNKIELVLENSELENLDILAITETWLIRH